MAYPFTEDHDMIREAARGFLQEWYDGGKGPERVYQSGHAYDPQAWRGFTQELGMAGISIDESYGGAELGDLGRVVIMEELGASLCAIPFSTTGTIVADLISACGAESIKSDWLGRIAKGELSAAYCDGHNVMKVTGGKISGEIYNVVHADCVDVIILTRRNGDKIDVFAVLKNTNGLTITSKTTQDPTRSFGDVALKDVSDADISLLGQIDEARLNDIVRQSFIGLAAECVGGAQACLDMTLGYTAQRVQFDRPIASFQAVKHRCADMYVLIEAARSAVYAAAIVSPEEKTEAALIAKAYAADAFFKVAGDAIQMHGGIGFTWEYPLHFFFKRARANRAMFGHSSRDYSLLADHILGDAA